MHLHSICKESNMTGHVVVNVNNGTIGNLKWPIGLFLSMVFADKHHVILDALCCSVCREMCIIRQFFRVGFYDGYQRIMPCLNYISDIKWQENMVNIAFKGMVWNWFEHFTRWYFRPWTSFTLVNEVHVRYWLSFLYHFVVQWYARR